MIKIDHRRKALLIVECDSAKLSHQNLAVGKDLQAFIKQALPENPVDLINSYTQADLLEKLGELRRKSNPYRDIVIIGHSNKAGLQLCSDRFDKWEGIATWFEPFKPHRIFLLACDAGRWLPCASLFKGIPTLKEIFGSPVSASKNQVYFVLFTILHRLGAKKMDRQFIKLMQGVDFLTMKGLMFSRTRSEFEQGGEVEGRFWNQAELIINQIVKMLRG